MNTQKSVYKKLFKEEATELASHKVELGAIDIYVEAYKKEAAKVASIKSKIISANDELGIVIGGLESLPNTGDKLIATMKELGIEKELAQVQAVNNAIKGLIKSLNPIFKNISSAAKSI
jgi:hypothetical protein